MGNWTALAVLTGVLPLLCSRALVQGGSNRAGADTSASVSFQDGNCAALRCLSCLGTLTSLAAQGTSALCRLPVWHRPSPAAILLLRGWTIPWHLDKGENTDREEITAEETFPLPSE